MEEALHYDKGESPYGMANYSEYIVELHKEDEVLKTKNKVLTKEIMAIFNHFYPLDETWEIELVDLAKLKYTEDIDSEYK